MDLGRRITIRAPSYDSLWFLCDRTMSFKEKMKRPMMVRVNLAQESLVGISVKNPGGARFPGITWDWLMTQNPGSPGEGQGTVHEVPTSKCCVLCSPQQLTLAPVTCQLFLPTLLPVDYISPPASSSARHIQEEAGPGFFGTFQGALRGADSCWRCCTLQCSGCGGAEAAPAAPHR